MAETVDQKVPHLLEPGAQVTIAIFGGLRLWRNGHEVEIGSQRQRIVLAELICAAGNAVSISTLVDAVWNQDPAASAVNQLHRIVGQLRRTLEPGLSPHAVGTTILASGNGYRIAVEQVQCDLYQLRELTRKAKNLVHGGDLQIAGRCYAEALELAQGALFGGLNSRVETRPEFLAVEQERVSTAISAADIAIDQGVTPQVLAGVTAIAASDPLNEPLHVRLIKLLDAAGRRAEALATFDAVRRRLAEELGVDPGAELAGIYSDLLSSDAKNAQSSAASGQPAKPAQLPRAVAGFVDRADAEELLADELMDGGGTVVITALGGMGGIGKTALAVQWAHRMADQFPDGQLFINLRGYDPGERAMQPDEALNALLEGLGQSPASLTELDTETRAARYRSLLADRRMIVVLDNARDSEQVRPLLPGSPNCLVIVTSRDRLASLVAREGARFVPLGRLPPAEARKLLINRLGDRRVAHDPGGVDQIISGCAGLPLALSIVAARIATSPEMTLSHVVGRLFAPDSGLDGLTIGQNRDDVRTVFSWSYKSLSSDGAHLFRVLGAHPGLEIPISLVASAVATDLTTARRLTSELVQAHLLAESTPDRFVMHDLLRVYAGEMLDAAQERPSVERRVVEHYLLATRAAYNVYGRAPIASLGELCEGLIVETCESVSQAIVWYMRERVSLAAVADLAISRGMIRQGILIILDRRPMNLALDSLSESLEQGVRALDAAAAAKLDPPEPGIIAELNRDVAGRYSSSGQEEMADRYFKIAVETFRSMNDFGGQANAYRSLANAASRRGDRALAVDYSREAVRLARLSKRIEVVAMSISVLAEILLEAELYDEAAQVSREALRVLAEAGIGYAVPVVSAALASAELHLGRSAAALEIAEATLPTLVEAPDPSVEAFLLAVATRSSAACGQFEKARLYLVRFHALMEQHRAMLEANAGSATVARSYVLINQAEQSIAHG